MFGSWNSARAIRYRQLEGIKGLLGTAVNVQSMVFGNFGDDSGTGVCFTRDPSTGENTFYGEFLINAQGEDVVAGIRTPLPLSQLREAAPEMMTQLEGVRARLEKHYRDMQDMEFTIQQGPPVPVADPQRQAHRAGGGQGGHRHGGRRTHLAARGDRPR